VQNTTVKNFEQKIITSNTLDFSFLRKVNFGSGGAHLTSFAMDTYGLFPRG